ncbi:type VI secretion system tip protein TssI/VgrG [Xenophilus arseniciresistens]|uniref:Type VI secretion system tip protein TssI/VgrG n=1 Tax=Xenophilus arseniciresistens TaxID=1283306 RepID=A0AAE3N9Y7_9BURK|nr:type VI secretion system tip protein TssI/VgrG [Xenophilus arseniciresistens]MDA7418770.1 type VI secretion system tip protein TssI/VgrG [Xenophilus arseniciresistens]
MAAAKNFSIESESPAAAEMLFDSVLGLEALSRPAHYELRVLSTNGAIDAKDVLGHVFDLTVEFDDADGGAHKRHFNGHAVRFVQGAHVGRYHAYHLTLRSWFWLLTKRRNSRIFQDKTVLQIIDAVLEDSAIKRFKKIESDHVIGVHEPRRYCMQHQESDYHFLSRLMEEEGIYYWFDAHDAPGTMLLSDASDVAHDRLPAASTLSYVPSGIDEARFAEIQHWHGGRVLGSGSHASRNSDFKAIKRELRGDKADPAVHELADLEMFEYAAPFWRNDDSDNTARLRMEELAMPRKRAWALTRWPDLSAGRSFSFKGAPDGAADGDYLVTSCLLALTHPGHEGLRPSGRAARQLGDELRALAAHDPINTDAAGVVAQLIDDFASLREPGVGDMGVLATVLPAEVPFRPRRRTPRPVMPGPQSAIVAGPKGEEIHADDFGRVKVHFHWDRYDERNEKSTCYVRVSQPWAGKGWGGYFIPRIGQEVIVDFLNGDPDRPLIVGRVYNDDQPIPFGSHSQSGFRTRSTPKGSASNFNELRFDDAKGSEQVYLHAEKNQDIEVENDETHWVGHDRSKTIDHDETVHVKHDRTETVDNNETITIGVNRTESVGNNETITIGVNRTESVGANETISIGANRSITVGASETATVALQRTHTVGINETITVGAAQEITVGAVQAITVGASQTITVGASQSSSIGANRSVDVGGNLSTSVGGAESRNVGKGRSSSVTQDDALKVGKNYVLEAGDSITLKTGSASITMKKDGTIVIKGKDITVQGSGKINVKASSDVIVKGSKVLQN